MFVALSCENRGKLDELVAKADAAAGNTSSPRTTSER
jgi:hypothetical protein